MECKEGMIVKSVSGHDSGTWHVVMKCGNGFAYIADGKLRSIEKPKKKNIRHIQKTSKFVELERITNKKLKQILHEYNYNNAESVAEEG